MKLLSVWFNLSPEYYDKLKKLVQEEDRTMSYIGRKIIMEYLDQREAK
jgi:predicted DNA-binding protein